MQESCQPKRKRNQESCQKVRNENKHKKGLTNIIKKIIIKWKEKKIKKKPRKALNRKAGGEKGG
jgi:hypothetical protein